MKKTLLFLILLLFPFGIYADSKTTFSFNDVTASAGNNVTVKLNMNNKQEFGYLTVRILYDNKKLEYVSDKINGLDAMLRGSDKNKDKGLVVLYAINLSSKYMKDSGNIWTVEFKVKDDVKEDIPLTLEIKDFGKDENTKLKYEKKDGLIKIKDNVEKVDKTKTDNLNSQVEEKDSITWSSTDEEVAKVDENGNVEFNGDGNVTIEAKDENGQVVYSKDYYVKEEEKCEFPIWIIISVVVFIIIVIVILFVWRKKCQRKK